MGPFMFGDLTDMEHAAIPPFRGVDPEDLLVEILNLSAPRD